MSGVTKTQALGSGDSWVHLQDVTDDVGTVVVEDDLQARRDIVITMELGPIDKKMQSAAQTPLDTGSDLETRTPRGIPSPTASEKDPPSTPLEQSRALKKAEKGSGCCEALKRCLTGCLPSFSRMK